MIYKGTTAKIIPALRTILLNKNEIEVLIMLCKEHSEIIELNVRNPTDKMKYELKVTKEIVRKLERR